MVEQIFIPAQRTGYSCIGLQAQTGMFAGDGRKCTYPAAFAQFVHTGNRFRPFSHFRIALHCKSQRKIVLYCKFCRRIARRHHGICHQFAGRGAVEFCYSDSAFCGIYFDLDFRQTDHYGIVVLAVLAEPLDCFHARSKFAALHKFFGLQIVAALYFNLAQTEFCQFSGAFIIYFYTETQCRRYFS